LVDFALPKELKSVISVFRCRNSSVIELTFTEQYNSHTIYSNFKEQDLEKSFKILENKIQNLVPTILPEHYNLIENVIYENLDNLKKTNKQDKMANGQDQKSIYQRKYEYNDKIFESIIINGLPTFLAYHQEKFHLLNNIEISGHVFYPADNVNTNNPKPYIFQFEQELEHYLQLSKEETFDSLFDKVLTEYEQYVNVDEHNLVTLAANTVYSYFQDKFGTTNYNILIGENGSGKNSALLVYRMLGYRVFYVTAANSANYYTFLGDIQEGQGTIAEDESDNIGYDHDKQRILNTGYASGGNVPKVEFNKNGNRSQSSYLTFCHKWLTMEELLNEKSIRGIIDRAFVHKFLIGDVKYNIKNILKDKNSDQYKQLIHLRKLLIAFKLTQFGKDLPLIKLNIKNRNKELTQPLLTLFNNGKNFDRIRLALSKLINEKSILKSNSIEAKIVEGLFELIKTEENNNNGQEIYEFSNEEIFDKIKEVMDGKDEYFGIKGSVIYLPDGNKLTKAKVSSLLKSKFKAASFRTNQKRGYRFRKSDIIKISKQYEIIEEIKIDIVEEEKIKSVTEVTEVTDFKGVYPIYYNDANKDSNDKKIGSQDPEGIEVKSNKDSDNNNLIDTKNQDNNLDFNTINKSNNSKIESNSSSIPDSNDNNNNNFESTLTSHKFDNGTTSLTDVQLAIKISEKNNINNNNNGIELKSNVNNTYTPSESVTSVTSVTDLPTYPCLFCSEYKTYIDFDMDLHLLEKHKDQLLKLPITGNLDKREQYVISLVKKKMIKNSLDSSREE
jgi:hypothetical protein